VSIYRESGTRVSLSSPGGTVTLDSEGAHDFCSDTHECFHYTTAGIPVMQEFRGYVKRVEVYFFDNAGTDDDYIRGFKVVYKGEDGVEVSYELAGDQSANQGSAGYQEMEVDFEDLAATVSGFDYDEANGKLENIQFKDEDGNNVGGCLGRSGGSCSTTGPRNSQLSGSPSDKFFVAAFTLTVSSDQTSSPGIYAITPEYAYVDMPNLLSASRTSGCYLDEHLDLYYIRNSAWDFSYDLDADDGVCGTIQKIYNLGDSNDVRNIAGEQDPGFEHSVLYYQTVSRERDDSAGGQVSGSGITITREGTWSASAFCYYDANGQVHSSFGTTGEEQQLLAGTNEFKYIMEVSKGATFSDFYTGGEVATALLNEDIFIRVAFDPDYTTNDVYTVVTTDCWATQTVDPTSAVRYDLEQDTCPVDGTFERVSGSGVSEEWFKFDAFGWYIGGTVSVNTVYLHCNVLACPPEDTSACNLASCETRRRRDLAREMRAISGPNERNSKVQSGTVTSSPLIVMRRDTTQQASRVGPKSQYSPLTAALASMFTLAALIALVVSVGLFLYKQKRVLLVSGGKYQQIQPVSTDEDLRRI